MRNRLFHWCPLVMATLLTTQVSAFSLFGSSNKGNHNLCETIQDAGKKAKCQYDFTTSKNVTVNQQDIREHQESKDQTYDVYTNSTIQLQEKLKRAEAQQAQREAAQRKYREDLKIKLEEEGLLQDLERKTQQEQIAMLNNGAIIKTFFLNDFGPDEEKLHYLQIPFIAATSWDGKLSSPKKDLTSADAMCGRLGYSFAHPYTSSDIMIGFTPKELQKKHMKDHGINVVGIYIEGNVYKSENVKSLDKDDTNENYIHFYTRITCVKPKQTGRPAPYTQNLLEMEKAKVRWDPYNNYIREINRLEVGYDAQPQSESGYSQYR